MTDDIFIVSPESQIVGDLVNDDGDNHEVIPHPQTREEGSKPLHTVTPTGRDCVTAPHLLLDRNGLS